MKTIFISFDYNNKKVRKRMLTYCQSDEKKKNHNKTQPINFSRFNIEFERPQQKREKPIQTKSIGKNHHLLESIGENNNNNIFEVRKIPRRLSENIQTNQLIFKSLQKQNNRKTFNDKTAKNDDKLKTINPLSLNKNDNKKLSLNQKSFGEKRQFRIVELLNLCKNNQFKISDQDSTENRPSSEKDKNQHRKSSFDIKKGKAHHRSNFQTSQKGKLSKNQSNFKLIKGKINLTSNVFKIVISPWTEPSQKKSISSQTIQSEPQFFEYLHYKRKKQQYERQLHQFFDETKIIEQDRKQVDQRKILMPQIYGQMPQDEREKRIFRIKEELDKKEQNLRMLVDNKCRMDEIQLKGIFQIEDATLSGLNKLGGTMKNYLLVFKQVFQKNSDPKYLRILQRLENLTSHVITEANKQIDYQIKKSKSYKKQSYNLRSAFNEYIDSSHDYKQLLRNCFQHLKKTPQLCYELIGEKSLENDMNLSLSDENNEFQKPKCVHCFNTNWKLHIISEQNLLMKSVLKVSEELLK